MSGLVLVVVCGVVLAAVRVLLPRQDRFMGYVGVSFTLTVVTVAAVAASVVAGWVT